MEPLFYNEIPSPIGPLLILGRDNVITALYTDGHRFFANERIGWKRDDERFRSAREQLNQYFAGQRTIFDLPLQSVGTPFQMRVWKALTEIPYGVTISYRELANRVGSPAAVRAVGSANSRNPISIVVPCHRVVGANGSLTGYAGGLAVKRALLDVEGRSLILT